jgi:uncharacterized delta-60 repeat protein
MISPLSTAVLRTNGVTRKVLGVLMLVLALLLSYTAPTPVRADDGDLDKSFGAGGKVITDFSGGEDEATAVAIQDDGKIFAVGSTTKPFVANNRDFALARYNTDGSLDTSFGSGGKVATDFFGKNDFALAAAIQQDGKIVAAGRHFKVFSDGALTGYYFAVARYNSDGSLDTNFGSGGKVTGDIGELDAIAIQNDGKILVAGFTFSGSGFEITTAFALARYNGDGSLDTSFGSGGKITTDFFGGSIVLPRTNVRAVSIQSDGKIVAAGSAYNSATRSSFFGLARYNDDGSLDTSFGSGGKVTTAILDGSSAMALAIHSDGKIVAAGSGGPKDAFPGFAVARYNSDGSLDTSFGSGGKATADFFGSGSIVRAVAFGADGEILAVGSVSKGAKGNDFAVARYNSNGSLDTRFGGSGKVFTELSKDEDDDAEAVAIQSDGQIVAVGATDTGADFALARYNTEQDFALAFEPSTINAERGTTVPVTFQISRKGGFGGNVTIAHSDTSALKIRVKPDSLSTTDTTVRFKLKIKAGAPTGQQQVTFTGKSDSGLERATTLNLVIQ